MLSCSVGFWLQSARPSAAEARNRPAETSGRPPPTNWLKRETPFVCDVRFTNDLPEVRAMAWST